MRESQRARTTRIQQRARRAEETLALLARLRTHPTPEDAIALHVLHERHERELGNLESAARAAERARAAAERLERRAG